MNVLLLGDSIRMFYQDEVKKQLGNSYEIYAPEENCRYSAYMLNCLRQWLPQFPTPDIIHFNAGLWDIAILYHEDGCFIGKEEYVGYMKKILRELKKTGAKIIFATSTPVDDNKQYLKGPAPPAGRNEDIIAYNKAVLQAFENEDIIVNDLFGLMYTQRERYISDDMVHPNDEGVKLLGTQVAEVIKKIGKFENKTVVKCGYEYKRHEEKTTQ